MRNCCCCSCVIRNYRLPVSEWPCVQSILRKMMWRVTTCITNHYQKPCRVVGGVFWDNRLTIETPPSLPPLLQRFASEKKKQGTSKHHRSPHPFADTSQLTPDNNKQRTKKANDKFDSDLYDTQSIINTQLLSITEVEINSKMNNFTLALRKTSSVLTTTTLTRSTIRQCVGASTVSSSSSNDQIGSSLQYRYFASSNGSNESMHVEISKVQGKSNGEQFVTK